jgi:hypothetical protein
MTATLAVPKQAGAVRQEWLRLAAAAAATEKFDPTMTAELPAAVQRWLSHAILPGTPLWRSVELTMHGQIKLGRWRPFTARQVLAPPDGYIWAATARLAGLPVTGYDRLSSGTGQMRWRLLGMIPMMTAAGPDVTRSAYGRLAGEICLLPTAFRHATWTEGKHPGTAVATWQFGNDTEAAELDVDSGGRLTQVRVNRWGNPDGAPIGRFPFGVRVEAEAEFGGIAIPSVLRAGWWRGTGRQREGDFFRAEITSAVFT